MNHKICNWIISGLVYSIWLYLAINTIRIYYRLLRMKGILGQTFAL